MAPRVHISEQKPPRRLQPIRRVRWRRLRDKGWRICAPRASGNRTLPQGESRLINVKKGLRKGLSRRLGHEVGEREICDLRLMIELRGRVGNGAEAIPAGGRDGQENPNESKSIQPNPSQSDLSRLCFLKPAGKASVPNFAMHECAEPQL